MTSGTGMSALFDRSRHPDAIFMPLDAEICFSHRPTPTILAIFPVLVGVPPRPSLLQRSLASQISGPFCT